MNIAIIGLLLIAAPTISAYAADQTCAGELLFLSIDPRPPIRDGQAKNWIAHIKVGECTGIFSSGDKRMRKIIETCPPESYCKIQAVVKGADRLIQKVVSVEKDPKEKHSGVVCQGTFIRTEWVSEADEESPTGPYGLIMSDIEGAENCIFRFHTFDPKGTEMRGVTKIAEQISDGCRYGHACKILGEVNRGDAQMLWITRVDQATEANAN
jgi:hypothetical protein